MRRLEGYYCSSNEECTFSGCDQPGKVVCYEGTCYTGTLDNRCKDKDNFHDLGDGGYCFDGRRDQRCAMRRRTDYETACSRGCSYVDKFVPETGSAGAGSVPSSGAAGASSSCAKPLEWPHGSTGPIEDDWGTRWSTSVRYPTDAVLSAAHANSPNGDHDQAEGQCTSECEVCLHAPCYSEVLLGGEYFSCCHHLSPSHCTAEQSAKIERLPWPIERDYGAPTVQYM